MIIYNWLHAAAVEIAEAGGVDPEFVEEVITKRCPFKIDTAYVEATGYAELITLRAQAKDLQSLYDALHLRLGQDNPYATIEKLRLDQEILIKLAQEMYEWADGWKKMLPISATAKIKGWSDQLMRLVKP